MPDQLNLIVVNKSRRQANDIKSLLEAELKTKVFLSWEDDLEQAEPQIQDFDFAVVSVDLGRKGQSLVGQRRSKPGLDLLRRLREQGIQTPIILTSVEDAQLFHEVQAYPSGWLAVEGTDFENGIVRGARVLIKQIQQPQLPIEPDKRLDVEFTLQGGNEIKWILQGINFPFTKSGIIDLDQEKLRKLQQKSKKIRYRVEDKDNIGWEKHLKKFAKELTNDIFSSNIDFTQQFYKLVGLVEETDRISIRFVVEEDVHPIALEVLLDQDNYWMLESPVYRRLDRPGGRYALYQDEADKTRPLNFLIIDAFTQEDVKLEFEDGSDFPLESLPNAREEASWLWQQFADNREFQPIGCISWIRGEKGDKIILETATEKDGKWSKSESTVESFREALKELFEKVNWDIVHYAGHSFYDEKAKIDEELGKTGYIFFPSAPLDYMDSIEFSLYLRESKVKLLYLSSCHSSEEAFMFRMAEQKIPGIIGYRWDVDDAMAVEYTKAFYSKLFETQSLENAFLKARKQLYRDHRNNPIWASPMLVIQVTKT